jgi:hypothetical protein
MTNTENTPAKYVPATLTFGMTSNASPLVWADMASGPDTNRVHGCVPLVPREVREAIATLTALLAKIDPCTEKTTAIVTAPPYGPYNTRVPCSLALGHDGPHTPKEVF